MAKTIMHHLIYIKKTGVILLALFYLIPFKSYAQDIYFGVVSQLYKMDIETYEVTPLPYTPHDYQKRSLLMDLAFHPNGKLYATTTLDLIEIDLKTGKSTLLQTTKGPEVRYSGLAINERGDFYVSGPLYLFKYDIENNLFYDTIYPQHIPAGYNTFSDLYGPDKFISRASSLDNLRQFIITTEVVQHQVDTLLELNPDIGSNVGYISKFYNNCGIPEYIGQAWDFDNNNEPIGYFLRLDLENGSIEQFGKDPLIGKWYGTASMDDFRQSPYLLDLDTDNSSYHMSGGFHDTLTLCDPVGQVADHDISIRLCGETIDSITFHIHDPDQIDILSETMQASETLIPTGPGQWRWENINEADSEKIMEFLRSVRYLAEWNTDTSLESALMVTTHIGSETTTSWSVFTLLGKDQLAGRDTTITYCNDVNLVHLYDYLPASAYKKGRFFPKLSGGPGKFIPGKDPDTTYLYITESHHCIDTSYLTLSAVNEGLHIFPDMVLCRGTSEKVGFPPGKYKNIEWYNGDTGDSTVINSTDQAPYWVSYEIGNCSFREKLNISVLLGNIQFHDHFSDTLRKCHQIESLKLQNKRLDSIKIQNKIYLLGDSIPFKNFGTYILTGYKFGCTVSKEITVLPDENCEEESDCIFIIPNAVSPNGDGQNDDLEIITSGCGNVIAFLLMDKWGNLQYKTNSSVIESYILEKLLPGSYVAQVTYTDQTGAVKSKVETVLVLK